MADELEVLEKQQLSAQRSLNDLTDQLTLADHLVYKKYLTELQNYGMVELSQNDEPLFAPFVEEEVLEDEMSEQILL